MCIFICSPPCSPSFQLHFYRRICQKSLNPWSPTVIQWRTVEGYGEDGQTHIESEFDFKWRFLFIFGYRWTTVVFRRNGKRLSTFLWTRRGTVLSRVVAKSGNFEGPHCGEHDVREPLMQSSVWDLRWHYLPFKVLIENSKNKGELAMLVFVCFCLWLLWPSQVTPKLTWGPRRSWTWESLRLKMPEILDVLWKIQTCSMGVRSLDFALSPFRKAGHPLRVLSLLASIIIFSIKVQICIGWKCMHNHHAHENNPNGIMCIQKYFYAYIFPICGFWPVVFWIEIRRVRMCLIEFFRSWFFWWLQDPPADPPTEQREAKEHGADVSHQTAKDRCG